MTDDTNRSTGNTGDRSVPDQLRAARAESGCDKWCCRSEAARVAQSARPLSTVSWHPTLTWGTLSTPQRYEQLELPFEDGVPSGETKMDMDLTAHANDVIDLVLTRHRKYGPKNIAGSPGGAVSGIAVRLYDKVARLANTGEDFSDESLADTLRDVVGYGLIGLLVISDQWPS